MARAAPPPKKAQSVKSKPASRALPSRRAKPKLGSPQFASVWFAVGTGFAILGVMFSGIYYFLDLRYQEQLARQEDIAVKARARISFDGRLNENGCTISVEGGRENCALEINATDPTMHVTSFAVQFPAGSISGRPIPIEGMLRGARVSLSSVNDYAVRRGRLYVGDSRNFSYIDIPLPVIFYSSYIFEGTPYSDRSLYYILYSLTPVLENGSQAAVPTGIIYCGRLAEEFSPVEFLIDPWVGSPVGYVDRPSTSIAFNCPAEFAVEVRSKMGEFFLRTDVGLLSTSSPQKRNQWSMNFNAVRFQSASTDTINLQYRFVPVGPPPLAGLPREQ